jgi:hypothetical protein
MMRPLFVLRVRAEPPGVDEIRALRGWLKVGLRIFGLRCLDVHEVQQQTGESVMINLNNVGTQRDRDTIEDGVYLLKAQVIPGGVGDDGQLRRGTKNKRQLMLELSCKVVGGEHAGHEIQDYPTVGIDESSNGNLPPLTAEQRAKLQTSLRIGLRRLKAIIDSAFRLDPNDLGKEAEQTRSFESYDFFNGLQFWAQVTTRAASGQYGASNQIDFVVVPGDPAYPDQSKAAVAPRKGWGEELDDEIPPY